ncbi:MAG: MBL fold metallo-hydrolase, partial [Candidatus Hydrothermarchaeales archaeon]
ILGNAEARVYGPKGTRKWVDALFLAYPYLEEKLKLEVKELEDGETVAVGDDRVTCASVCHAPNSIAYRVDSENSIVYSGDTEPCAGVKTLISDEVDILIHECTVLDFSEHRAGHTTPTALGKFLKDMQVNTLVLTHISPEISDHEQEIVKILKQYFTGEITVGKDLLSLKIPLGE